jgi:hypothetical protein
VNARRAQIFVETTVSRCYGLHRHYMVGTTRDTVKQTDRYLVIVPASEPALFDYLAHRLEGDHRTDVIVDRRHSPRQGRPVLSSCHRVVVVRCGARRQTAPAHLPIAAVAAERTHMEETQIMDDRQRVDRWLEESQYLMGRLIPGFLDDRERLKVKLEQTEEECSRMRMEILELRKEVQGLQGDVQFYKSEQATAIDTMSGVMETLNHLQRPLGDLYRRMQTAHPLGAEMKV